MPNPVADAIAAVVAEFARRRPIRAGSLIVTIYGDAVQPRGGALWLGSLLEMMAGFGVEPGLVRTALSRLVADGWFERTRVGKRSFYRLSPGVAAEFAVAGERIYGAGDPRWSGELELVLIATDDAARRAELREGMLRQGYGQAAPNVLLRPEGDNLSKGAAAPADIVRLTARLAQDERGAMLARACWQLDDVERAYRRFIAAFGPLERLPGTGQALGDADAFRLRILLIHEWRRIVLRDPQLPRAMLPKDWPGLRAREVCARLYRLSCAGAERWLDTKAVDENGPLMPAEAAAAGRFEQA